MRFFILEDEIDKEPRIAIVRRLKSMGHRMTIAKSFDEAKTLFDPNNYGMLLLDHDMRGFYEAPDYPNTGYQFVKWMTTETNQNKTTPIVIHSQNPRGAARMWQHLTDEGFESVSRRMFSNNYLDWLMTL